MVLDYAAWPVPGWEALPGRVNGKRPSEASFFDFEYWLYFRILRAVRYPETRNDPFRLTKHRDLTRQRSKGHLEVGPLLLPADLTVGQVFDDLIPVRVLAVQLA